MDNRNIYGIPEGSIRNVKHVQPDKYWENDYQMSQPATEEQIKA